MAPVAVYGSTARHGLGSTQGPRPAVAEAATAEANAHGEDYGHGARSPENGGFRK